MQNISLDTLNSKIKSGNYIVVLKSSNHPLGIVVSDSNINLDRLQDYTLIHTKHSRSLEHYLNGGQLNGYLNSNFIDNYCESCNADIILIKHKMNITYDFSFPLGVIVPDLNINSYERYNRDLVSELINFEISRSIREYKVSFDFTEDFEKELCYVKVTLKKLPPEELL